MPWQKELTRIRAVMETERLAIDGLERCSSLDAEQLADLLVLLDVIEVGFLRQDVKRHPRSDKQWEWWLGKARNLLSEVTSVREQISQTLPKTVSPVAEFLAKHDVP